MFWKDFSRTFKDGEHSFLSPSIHSWINYNDDKLVTTYLNRLAASRGTALHALACNLIKMKVALPDAEKTLNMYVNDCIRNKMRPEEKLYYSKFCFGTADAINFKDRTLKVFDLKTGKTKVSFMQLRIYAALFFLCYPEIKLSDVEEVELRLYQNNEIMVEKPEVDDILPIMDKISRYSRILQGLEDEYDEGSTTHWSSP